MSKFTPGEIVYTFLGEELLEAHVLHYEDDIRLAADTPNARICVYEAHCYPTAQEAIDGMQATLLSISAM